MFFDWLTIYQDFDFELPVLGDTVTHKIDCATGEHLATTQPSITHKGSFSTSIQIRISGNRITVSGNPSRVNRLDNLFGLTTLDECVAVYNAILKEYGLPEFTQCTKYWQGCGKDGEKVKVYTNGAIFTEMHVTTNLGVGHNNQDDFIAAVSTLPYRNSIPRLHTNKKTCDWLTKKGKASLIYPSVYNKAYELQLHAEPKAKKTCGVQSIDYAYLKKVIRYCQENGVVRFEQKLKSAFLRREDFHYYDNKRFPFDKLKAIHKEFLNIHEKLQVTAMRFDTLTELLKAKCELKTLAANTTAMYAMKWAHGEVFNFDKKQVRVHRARLRVIGIDIKNPCDLTKFSLVTVKRARDVEVKELDIPSWYRRAA